MLSFIFFGCAKPANEYLKDSFQTSGAQEIRYYVKDLKRFLIDFSFKLYKRNPKIFDANILQSTIKDIENSTSDTKLIKENMLMPYIDYFDIAFSEKNVENRGNYLIIGIYRMLTKAFDMENGYKLTAMSYDLKKLENLYKMFQVLAWKIKTKRDLNGNYLFLTWQNNWQIELEKKLKSGEKLSFDLIESLKYIKEKKETLLSPCNKSFAMIYAKMLYIIGKCVEIRGGEPTTLGISTLKTLVFLPL